MVALISGTNGGNRFLRRCFVAILILSRERRRTHGETNARRRRRPTSTATPPLLTTGRHSRSSISTARTSAGPRIRLLDSVFALCRALKMLDVFWCFVGALVSVPKSDFLTRLRPRSRQRSEQNRGRRPEPCQTLRPQVAQVIFRVTLLCAVARWIISVIFKFPLPGSRVNAAGLFLRPARA
jgi:hypothetical protein